MAARDPTAAVQLKFRVREGLRAKLEEAAKAHGWTLNAEITRRLQESFEVCEERRQLEIEQAYMRRSLAEAQEHAREAQRRTDRLTAR